MLLETPILASVSHATRPFQLLHMDLWGPGAPVEYFSGYKNYYLIVDDYSRFSWVAQTFSTFGAFVLNHFHCDIRTIRSDNGRVFFN